MLAFLGIGAQKAGTTWLYEQLRQHSQLAFPLGKEAHFWNHPYDITAVNRYLNHFIQTDGVTGEITPAYGMLSIETIDQIYQHTPDLRLIYLIRNPLERAWSSALMALGRAEMMLDEASDGWFIDHFRSAGSLKRGDYQYCLQNWRTVFPNEQLLVLRFEHIITEPEALLNRCFQHLGVEQQDPIQLRQRGCREQVFAGPGYPLRPTLKPILQSLYRRKIEQLASYLDTDLNSWLDG